MNPSIRNSESTSKIATCNAPRIHDDHKHFVPELATTSKPSFLSAIVSSILGGTVGSLAVIVAALLVNTSISVSATPVYFSGTGNYYELIAEPGVWPTWSEARDFAAAQVFGGVHGHLATIRSLEENDFLAAMIPGGTALIGGFQPTGSSEPDGNWQWVTGEPFDFTRWHSGEPNDSAAEPGIHNYLELYGTASLFYGTWNDTLQAGDGPGAGFIVEYETASAVPDSQSTAAILLLTCAALGLGRRYLIGGAAVAP